jgi:Xaa-Pro aminopeptidase
MMQRCAVLVMVGVLALVTVHGAPSPYFTDVFPLDEFAARRARVFSAIGDGVAVLHGAPEMSAEVAFRQNNQFFYLTGVEVPRAVVVLDGRTKQSTLFLQAPRRERYNGPDLGPGEEAARVTGLDAVLPRDALVGVLSRFSQQGRPIYTAFRAEVRGGGSTAEAIGHAVSTATDPWDGRPSREAAFIARLRGMAPGADIRDLDPILDGMRYLKSPREIAVMREITRITGLGIMEAMREAAPGRFEYELSAAAEWVFRRHNSQGPAYFPLSAAGPNTIYSHYHRGLRKLEDGDIVQFDYAPDWKYYTSDISRVFPANGRFTPRQREFYVIYLRLYQALMASIAPGVPVPEIAARAGTRMRAIIASYAFTDPKIRAAAEAFASRYTATSGQTGLGHSLGLEVHDVSAGRTNVLQPGELFTIEPPIVIEDELLSLRIEDVILITEAGYENLSTSVPIEIDDIERLMGEPGISDRAAR